MWERNAQKVNYLFGANVVVVVVALDSLVLLRQFAKSNECSPSVAVVIGAVVVVAVVVVAGTAAPLTWPALALCYLKPATSGSFRVSFGGAKRARN